MVYSIIGGNDKEQFVITQNGTITTAKSLDRETQSLYNLVVMATDQAKPPEKRLSSTVQVLTFLFFRSASFSNISFFPSGDDHFKGRERHGARIRDVQRDGRDGKHPNQHGGDGHQGHRQGRRAQQLHRIFAAGPDCRGRRRWPIHPEFSGRTLWTARAGSTKRCT